MSTRCFTATCSLTRLPAAPSSQFGARMQQLSIPDDIYVPLAQIEQGEAEAASTMGARLANLLDWLIDTHHCGRDVIPYAERLCREFGRVEAEDRVKGLLALCDPDGDWSLADADYMGIYDHAITDHHVIWDRAWAIRMLVPRELVPKVWKCGYGATPKFFDSEGSLLFESIYTKDGRCLSREVRRRLLEEREKGEQC